MIANYFLESMKHPISLPNYVALLFLCSLLFVVILVMHSLWMNPNNSKKIYLVDFACYKPEASNMISKKGLLDGFRPHLDNNETLEFMERIIDKCGLGDSTYVPNALIRDPPNPCMEEARSEAEMVIFGAIDRLLAKMKGYVAKDIGILVVNCSIFNVVPSLSAMIVNRYQFGDGILSYNLSGMGCSSGLIAIGLARNLLQVHPNSHALVVSTENITQNYYLGKDRSKVLANCIFRVGGAAILLSNRPSDRRSSKYQLIHTVHVTTAYSDSSYKCIFQEEDGEGKLGVNISRDLTSEASKSIQLNLITLGRLVLPVSKQLSFLINQLIRSFHVAKIKPHVPEFNKTFDHFLPHAGGRPLLDELQRVLGFRDFDMEPARKTLYRYGNTSSSTVWYQLAYCEASERIKRGDSVWHIAFGSGFHCTSVVWRAIRTVDPEKDNPWIGEI
ncbi:FAE1/Type III polyketide synthase-like protein [Dillenia turbinata]|uniref:3-ketoacyl-CoA synthase n=1 Tax=Dillenia turbinata TaxID=194707 RepID=A0AAN8VP21_9MAGN